MGVLRLLLALSVVIYHTGRPFGFSMVYGPAAVQCFYMISGFYMALVLNEKYFGAPGGVRAFYRNRALRIYPAYLLVTAVTLIAAPGTLVRAWHEWWPTMGALARALGALVNIVLFGQDWFMFLGLGEDGSLHWTPNFVAEARPAWQLLLVPPAWSLGLELTFYVIAPWVVTRRVPLQVGLVAASFLLRALGYSAGLSSDPWETRFFPFELAFFVLGSLGWRVYARSHVRNEANPSSPPLIAMLVIAATLLQAGVPLLARENAIPWGYYVLLLSGLPALFRWSRDSRRDAAIGELSYPLYLVHPFVIQAVQPALFSSRDGWILAVIFLSLCAAWLVSRAVRPVEAFRRARTLRSSAIG